MEIETMDRQYVNQKCIGAVNVDNDHTLVVTYKGMTFVCHFTEITTTSIGGHKIKMTGTVNGFGE